MKHWYEWHHLWNLRKCCQKVWTSQSLLGPKGCKCKQVTHSAGNPPPHKTFTTLYDIISRVHAITKYWYTSYLELRAQRSERGRWHESPGSDTMRFEVTHRAESNNAVPDEEDKYFFFLLWKQEKMTDLRGSSAKQNSASRTLFLHFMNIFPL